MHFCAHFNHRAFFAEVLSVPQHGSRETIEATRIQNDPAMVEGRSHRHCNDLANADCVKLQRFPFVRFCHERDTSLAGGRPVN